MARKLLITLALAGSLTAQSPAPPEKFEVDSVKLIPPDRIACTPTDRSRCLTISPWGSAIFTARNVSMPVLVELAYSVTDKQISGIDRLGSEAYDISAKPEHEDAISLQRLRPMLKALLEERFNLQAHRETKDVQGYVLTVTKGGPKLKPGDTAGGQNMILPGRLIGPNATIAQLAPMLERPLGGPVVDKTNLSGAFNIDLKFAPDGDAASTQPSIFTAVQEQLGLKLESQKVPFETLIIDHCDRIPTQN